MVDMGLVFCIKVNLWTIQRSVTMVELDMGMSFNTIVGWNIKLISWIIYHCDSFEFQVHNGDHNEVGHNLSLTMHDKMKSKTVLRYEHIRSIYTVDTVCYILSDISCKY